MSKLTLQYEGIALKDYPVGLGLTIGRLPDNAVIIDNPAVSGHHARVYAEGDPAAPRGVNSLGVRRLRPVLPFPVPGARTPVTIRIPPVAVVPRTPDK